MPHEVLVEGFLRHVDEFTFLAGNLAAAHLNGCYSHLLGVTRRVETEHIFNGGVAFPMIVTEKDDVQSLHLFGYLLRGVLVVLVGDDTTVPTTMEQSDDDICLLLFAQDLHPALRTGHHLFETHTRPEVLVQPVGNGGSQHAENSYAYALAFNDNIWLDIGFAALQVDDVRTDDGTVKFLNPFVVNLMSNLHVVVAESLGVVFHVIDDLSGNIGFVGGHEIGVVAGGLTLQDVTILKENQPIAHLLALALEVTAHTGHCTAHVAALGEIIGKERSVNVGCLHDA